MNPREHAAVEAPAETVGTIDRNRRYGLWLFGVYLLFYGAYVLMTAFAPEWMRITVLAGLNLAIVFGFALIVIAFVLALIYGWLCRRDVAADDSSESARL